MHARFFRTIWIYCFFFYAFRLLRHSPLQPTHPRTLSSAAATCTTPADDDDDDEHPYSLSASSFAIYRLSTAFPTSSDLASFSFRFVPPSLAPPSHLTRPTYLPSFIRSFASWLRLCCLRLLWPLVLSLDSLEFPFFRYGRFFLFSLCGWLGCDFFSFSFLPLLSCGHDTRACLPSINPIKPLNASCSSPMYRQAQPPHESMGTCFLRTPLH
ncbi:hypothetical protein CPC08DRAFT_124511 [Agrocybe pediades]|nr:hypothetical protein CPC08DRAFT_124511 [Agrocybe pediades]